MRTPTWKSDIGDVTTAIRKYCNYHLPSGAESATVLNVKKIRGSEPCWVADVEYSYGYQNGEKMTTIQQEEFPCDSEIFMYSSRKNEMNSKKLIKSSPNFKEFTADDIFDSFQVEELTHTVFMDREQCKANKCGMDDFTELMWDVVPTYLGVQTVDDVREVCRRAKNPKAKAFLEAFETALENAKFVDKFYDSIKIHKKGNVHSSRRNNMIKSTYTREDYDRFDEVGNFIPYQPTEEELAKKDEIKKVLEQELSKAYEPDPMDDYVGYDSTNERIDMACERVAKQFGVDTDFVEDIAGEIEYELWVDGNKEWEWVNTPGNLTGEQYDQYMNGELDVRPLMLKNSRQIKSEFESRPIHSLPKFDREEFFKDRGKKRNDPYNEGYEAFSNGLSITDNPNKFMKSTKYSMSDWDLWELGYKDAEKGNPKHNPVKIKNTLEKLNRIFRIIYDISLKENNNDLYQEIFELSNAYPVDETNVKEFGNKLANIARGYGWDSYYYEIKDLLNSSLIKSSYEDAFTVHPWDTNQVTGTSDEDLGLSYVVETYGNEFVNVDDKTLNDIRDEVLLRYFDDDAFVRDWNINNPDSPIESIYDIEDPEDLNNEELARYFDYEAYGRDLRLNHNIVWDSEEECWVSAHDVDDNELDNDKYIFMRG